jgi:hypothetical protein
VSHLDLILSPGTEVCVCLTFIGTIVNTDWSVCKKHHRRVACRDFSFASSTTDAKTIVSESGRRKGPATPKVAADPGRWDAHGPRTRVSRVLAPPDAIIEQPERINKCTSAVAATATGSPSFSRR